MEASTTIKLTLVTKSRLDELIEKKGDTYDDIIKRLLNRAKKN